MSQEKRLGRGLEALLGRRLNSPGEPQGGSPVLAAEPQAKGLANLSVEDIDSNPFQPRTDFREDEIQQLAESIQEHGLLQPIVVRRHGERYQIVAGERRLRAAIRANLDKLPAQVKDVDDRQMAELAIIENLQRKDLNPLEKAASFKSYLKRYKCKQEDLAQRLKINRSTIANLIRLLELPEGVQKALRERKITQGHARALLPLGDESLQMKFCRRIQKEEMNVRAVEELVKETIRQEDEEPLGVFTADESEKRGRDDNLAALEQEFRAALGTKVDVKQSAGGAGRIVIHFNNEEEFSRLRDHLGSVPVPLRKAA